MKYLITGNLGYIGPVLCKFIKQNNPNSFIIGYDTGFFLNSQIASELEKERPYIDIQIYGDVRDNNKVSRYIKEVDYVIHLAAISNDPMGKEFEIVTHEINNKASIDIAKAAIKNKCKAFVFASSCSVYGQGSDKPRKELDTVNPLTAYAKSKISTENNLKEILLESSPTKITCLRFATACGYSPNLRLDLVLNDFVATAISENQIKILSDGTPWRPLIDIEDMARALYWACHRNNGKILEIMNAGSPGWNYQVKDLAYKVSQFINNKKNINISINKSAAPDKRSYRVNFDKFYSLAPKEFTPQIDIETSIKRMVKAILPFKDRLSLERRDYLIRLCVLKNLKKNKKIDDKLYWVV